MQCTLATLDFSKYTAGVFLKWVESQIVTSPEQVDTRFVRQYLAVLTGQDKADKTLHAHSRAIRTLLRFWDAEHYIPSLGTFAMPRMEKKRLPCYRLNSSTLFYHLQKAKRQSSYPIHG